MMETAIYSVLSPEGAASIIYKDAGKVAEASEALKLTAKDMLDFHVIEGILPEGERFSTAFQSVRDAFIKALDGYHGMSREQIRQERYDRFRKLGGGWV